MNILLEMEGYAALRCSICSQSSANIKCSNCFGGNIFCRECCLQHHQTMPFHHMLEWNGRHYAATTLYTLGFILYLGHHREPCPKTAEVFALK